MAEDSEKKIGTVQWRITGWNPVVGADCITSGYSTTTQRYPLSPLLGKCT